MRKVPAAIAVFVFMSAGACTFWKTMHQDSQEREQIQTAIDAFVSQSGGIDLKTTNKDIQEFLTDRDRAEVLMKFTPKQGGTAQQIKYRLEREKGVWSVKSATPFVGGMETKPQVTPPPTSKPPAPRGR